MMLSENFTLSELTKSTIALRIGMQNTPSVEHTENLRYLCVHILQPVRYHFGSPVDVGSGFRTPELCVVIGSNITSQHTKGEAADFEIMGVSNEALAVWIDKNLDYDQIILEYHDRSDKNSGWVHASIRKDSKNNRKEFLEAKRNSKGETYYEHYKRSKL